MTNIPDQEKLWDEKHDRGAHAAHRGHPARFAEKAIGYFPAQAAILEIGSGVGSDSIFFAEHDHNVVATDISSVVLDQGRSLYADEPNIQFQKADASKPLEYGDNQFDVVYAHLALHYYDNATTRAVFGELHRVLRQGGVLAFACKSTDDVDYGKGEEIEKDFFNAKGHVRHFFTTDYVQSLLGGLYDVVVLENTEEHYSDKVSAFVQCVAIKK